MRISIFSALAVALLSNAAFADNYCVAGCNPAVPGAPPVFKCDSGRYVGGELGKVLCGMLNPSCSISFFDNSRCGSGTLVKDRSEFIDHAVWVIFHEGCGAWDGDKPVEISAFRDCYDKRQSSELTEKAKFQIKTSSDAEVRAVIDAAVAIIPSKFDLPKNFSWFCTAKNRNNIQNGKGVHEAAARGDFQAIRRSYNETQKDNPNAKNLLFAVKDSDISRIYVKNHCPQ